MNTFVTETDAKYVKLQTYKATAVIFAVLSLFACLGFLVAWQTFAFFEAIVLVSCAVTVFSKNSKSHDYILRFAEDRLYITDRTTGHIHEVSDLTSDDIIINQTKAEEKADCGSVLIKDTVFAFGGVKKCRELKKYISDNLR